MYIYIYETSEKFKLVGNSLHSVYMYYEVSQFLNNICKIWTYLLKLR